MAEDELFDSGSRPFDEKEDEVSLKKGLAFFSQNKPQEAVEVLRRTSARRSSLMGLNFPFIALPPDEDEGHEAVGSSFRVSPSVNLQDGCYLIYDAASGGTLVLHYSREEVPDNSVGFWMPGTGQTIREFKYQQAGGYVELIRGIIGGEKNRKQYLSGWCQFVQMAKSLRGKVKKFPNPQQGMKVDIYGFVAGSGVCFLDMDDNLVDVSRLDAVAVVHKDNDRFVGVKGLTEIAFLEMGNLEGASMKLHA